MTLLLAMSLLSAIKSGNASRYGYAGDPYDNVGTFACRGRLEQRYGSKAFAYMRNRGVAHRTLPCGARIGICLPRTGLCTTAFVVDRGPWGTLNRNGEWHVRTGHVPSGEHYRGELDLLPGTYTSLGLVGIEKVLLWQIAEGGAQSPDVPSAPPIYPPLRPADPARRLSYNPVRVATLVGASVFPPLRTADPPAVEPYRPLFVQLDPPRYAPYPPIR